MVCSIFLLEKAGLEYKQILLSAEEEGKEEKGLLLVTYRRLHETQPPTSPEFWNMENKAVFQELEWETDNHIIDSKLRNAT